MLKNGDVCESGSHDQLMAKNGFYAELYNSRFETTALSEEELKVMERVAGKIENNMHIILADTDGEAT